MRDRYAEFRELGAEVLTISFAPPQAVAAYVTETPMPFPVLSDPSREAYRAFDLGRTSWFAMVRLGIIGRFLRLMLRGWRPRRPGQDEDVMQLGGDFVLDGQRRLVYAYRSAEPTDRPSVEELLGAVRRNNLRV